jgi:hypothetical protein
VSWLSLARGTGGGAAATRRDIEVTTPASVRAVISPCRKGTEAAGTRSGNDGPGFPSRGTFFPAHIPRRPSFGFGQEAANAGCPGRSAERCGCRVQKRLRKESTKCSAAPAYSDGTRCANLGSSEDDYPWADTGSAGGPCCRLPSRLRKEPVRAVYSNSRSGSEETAMASA